MIHRFAVLAILGCNLPGCASRPANEGVPPRVICVSDRAVVGGRVRVRSPQIAPEHSPTYVITKIQGPTRHCAKNERWPITAFGVPDWQYKGSAETGDLQ